MKAIAATIGAALLLGCAGPDDKLLGPGKYRVLVPGVVEVCTNTPTIRVYDCGRFRADFLPYEHSCRWDTWIDWTRGSVTTTITPTNGLPVGVTVDFDGANTIIMIEHGSNRTTTVEIDQNGETGRTSASTLLPLPRRN